MFNTSLLSSTFSSCDLVCFKFGRDCDNSGCNIFITDKRFESLQNFGRKLLREKVSPILELSYDLSVPIFRLNSMNTFSRSLDHFSWHVICLGGGRYRHYLLLLQFSFGKRYARWQSVFQRVCLFNDRLATLHLQIAELVVPRSIPNFILA